MLNWQQIDTVLLDMDGTLLDLHFDNHFWLEFIPAKIAQQHNISFEDAKTILIDKYHKVAGQIEWYCLDYWQKELNLPIAQLKREVQHLIAIREDVPDFLNALRKAGKKLILLTNAHPDSLSLKIERTQLDGYLDVLISTHEFGVSKEHQALWQQLQARLNFDKNRTLFVDDSLTILKAAHAFGIGHLLAIANPDSKLQPIHTDEFLAITDYRTLLPIAQSHQS
ncbi:GMP/IMP nucleotidase [Pseudoalteromonas tunicata]|uniref:Putative hydrolase, contains a phosphatase-like domain n=1 Tax=Pseudoalteromonas tunicata D2 TaxID=87626 RepID=A4CFW0_9GAMM|nr:GMP/IMP nucleotidase [Pseudoalteromonas tunicata]ATC96255.1 putative hydrolase of the HAD superfamily [Pseudoalteromonas tunicata]AXT31767.1 GMP/IMP nucleotidase [Pseudoalteromonas tunicata]EAR26397.1 putative hydrolase, contains a phosphatase-like domain [Pseudoalteromonas tunicata D2]